MTRKIYLAGPDCFRADAFEHFATLKAEATSKGMHAFSPLDSEVDINAADILKVIYEINVQDIDEADVVLANVEPFRGACVDDGTAFEIGMAAAKGKPIVM